ncbi:MAG: class B sortase [Clostridiales bacterium]|nr:class B sortase [Clostridiales bacterium]
MQRGHIPGQNQTSRKKQRKYAYMPTVEKRRRNMLLCAILLGCVMVFSAWQLISYAVDYFAAQRASNELRELYYEPTEVPTASPTPSPAPTPTPTLEPEATPTPSPTPATHLEALRYPGNPYSVISSRFQKLRRQNGDIVGWLSIRDMLDEAVVQRDNTYYLRRDYRGYHNVNGALFLDESINLKSRPYTLLIYGHNMKTGAMFGNLRNYENLHYYQKNPFVTFDTMYEEGRYVIFAITELSTNSKDYNYFSFGRLNTNHIAWRSEAISDLKSHSVFLVDIDVQPDDQLLLLITCVDDEEERRVVAARRVREGETEEALQRKVNSARKW